MDRKYIDDNHIIERYLAEKLSDEECAAFETYYLQHPDVVEAMELTARVKVGMAKLAESGELQHALAPRRGRTAVTRFAAAAAVLLMIALGAYYWADGTSPAVLAASVAELNRGLESPLDLVDGPVRVMRSRAGEETIALEVPGDARALELAILSETPAFRRPYRVSIVSSAGQRRTIGVVDDLAVDQYGVLHVYLNSRALEPGAYELRIQRGDQTASDASVFNLVATRH